MDTRQGGIGLQSKTKINKKTSALKQSQMTAPAERLQHFSQKELMTSGGGGQGLGKGGSRGGGQPCPLLPSVSCTCGMFEEAGYRAGGGEIGGARDRWTDRRLLSTGQGNGATSVDWPHLSLFCSKY